MFTPCKCSKGCKAHAIITALDMDGTTYPVRVPYEHRYSSIGWGDRPRVRFGDSVAVEVARGEKGVQALDELGNLHRLNHGAFSTWIPERKGKALKKAEVKAGQRWITVHPGGEGSTGVPILIQEEKDGTHRVVAGAGGKLTHLRLENVKSADEYAKSKADKKAAKKEKDKTAPKEVKETKKEAHEKKREAERQFVKKVSTKLGGVSEDRKRDESESPAVARRLDAQHHRKQVNEAKKRAHGAMQAVVAERTGQERAKALTSEDTPEVSAHVQETIRAELDDEEAAQKARKEARAPKMMASRAVDPGAQEKAVVHAVEAVKQAPEQLDKTLEALGGRTDSGEVLRLSVVPAVEAKRRSLQALQDAQIIHEALSNGPPKDEKQQAIVEQALGGAKLGTEEAKEALQTAMVSKVNEAERHEVQSRKLDQIARDKGEDVADRALRATDAARAIARETQEARRLGLDNPEKTPLTVPETDELMDVVKDLQDLKAKTRALKNVVKDAEKGNFDRSRRAFKMDVQAAPKDVEMSIEEEVQRSLTEQLLGAVKTDRPEYIQGVTAGHYDALADVGLQIGGQRYLDRPTVDALGAKNAAILLRYGLDQDGHDMDAVRQAVEESHVDAVKTEAAKAIEKARSYVPGLVHEVDTTEDAEAAMAHLDAHESEIVSAQKALSSAIGRLEGTATLGQALRDKMPDSLSVRGTSLESSQQWVHSLGLHPADYEVNAARNEITIPRRSWDKLLSRDSREDIDNRRVVNEIKAGQHDIKGWLPPGIAYREASTFTAPVPSAPRMWEPLSFDGDLDEAIKTHVGARLASGEHIGEIASDISSEGVASQAPSAKEYRAALERHFPLYKEGGKERLTEALAALGPRPENENEAIEWDRKAIKAEQAEKVGLTHFADKWESWAQDYMEKKHGGEGAYHSQNLHPEDVATREAIFRTLADHPEGKIAFKPSGQLTPQEEGVIRDRYYQRMGIDPKVKVDEARFQREMAQASMPEGQWETMVKEHEGEGITPGQAKARAMSHLGEKVKNEAYYQELTKPWDKTAGTASIDEPKDVKQRRQYLTRELAALGKEPDRQDKEANQKWQEARNAVFEKADTDSGKEELDETSPEYRAWQKRRDAVLARHPRAGMQSAIDSLDKADPEYASKVEAIKQDAATAPTAWGNYVEAHGSRQLAIEALQDEMRGEFVKTYQEHHGKVTGNPLRVGVQDVTNKARHIRATGSPEEIAQARAEERSRLSSLQKRQGGGFTEMGGAGSAKALFTKALEQDEIDKSSQLAMFGSATSSVADLPEKKIEPKTGQRWSLGTRAESQLESVINGGLGQQFQPGSPIRLFGGLNMDGDRIHQQRVLRQLDRVKRMAALLGTGAGKSLTSIAGFTQAHAKGEASHGLYLVPAAVQDQFGGEMLRYTQPGKYNWATGGGKSHAERVRMLKDPSIHMRVMTHQSFRDTALKLMADHHGRTTEKMTEDFGKADPKTRARWMREAFDAHGIPRHFVYYDEAHTATSENEKSASLTHDVATAVTHPSNATHLLLGTATPTKNNTGEMHSWASLLDPDKYADRWKFMQNFGRETAWNPNAIRQELGHRVYTARIDPEGVSRTDTDNPTVEEKEVQTGENMWGPTYEKQKVKSAGKPIELHPTQKARVDEITAAYEQASTSFKKGHVDVESIRKINPAPFEGKTDEQAQSIARNMMKGLGFTRDAALERAINRSPVGQNAKLDALASVVQHDLAQNWTDRKGNARKGKASIIFSDSAQDGKLINQHLRSLGVRSAFYHGGLPNEQKEAIRTGFQPEQGEPKHDVIVATSAAEAGLNLQRASVLHNYDVPQTEKSHAQRAGRAYRQGQLGDVEIHNWHTNTAFERRALQLLKEKRYLASVFQTPIGHMDDTGTGLRYTRIISRKHEAAA
ncbi:MAG: helicase-related protein [Thermoleophilia bacterium]